MKLAEIASGINNHLKRFEADPEINQYKEATRAQDKLHPYWNAGAGSGGRFVNVTYVSYQGSSHLSKAEAAAYLAWLNAGNIGTHFHARRETGVQKMDKSSGVTPT